MFRFHLLLIHYYSPPIAPAIIAAGIGALGSMAGGLLGSSGAKDANKNAREINAFNLTWQERMSNTSYRRAMYDMKQAGLNPMLAYMQGGASTPSAPSAPVMQNEKAAMGQGIANASMAAAQLQNMAATTAQSETQATKNLAEANLATAAEAETRARTPGHAITQEQTKTQTLKMSYEIANVLANTHLTDNQTRKVSQEIVNLATQNKLTDASIREVLARTNLTTAQIAEVQPRIRKMAAEVESLTTYAPVRRTIGTIREYFDDPDSLGSSARDFFKPDSSRRDWKPSK